MTNLYIKVEYRSDSFKTVEVHYDLKKLDTRRLSEAIAKEAQQLKDERMADAVIYGINRLITSQQPVEQNKMERQRVEIPSDGPSMDYNVDVRWLFYSE